MTKGLQRTAWIWAMGYLLRENISDWRVAVIFGTGPLEVTSTYTGFESLRQEMLDFESAADDLDDSELRADARRTMIAYYNVRSFRRITGLGNSPVASYKGDALSTLAVGGGWTGICYEAASLVFPDLRSNYSRLGMMEKMAAMTNAISSLPRDQREGSTNALIPVYSDPTVDLAEDFIKICDWLEIADGRELSIVGHYVAATNNHSRYIMLAVFLAAARLGRVSLETASFDQIWTAKAIVYGKRMQVPPGCISTTQEEREPRIVEAVSRLWVHIQTAQVEGTDNAIQWAQRQYHRVVDEEVQGIYWKQKDPVVLWAVSAALYRSMLGVGGMAKLLLRGDSFKSLEVPSDGFEDVWLREIYNGAPK
jgi:hypothetical protein